MPAVTVSASSGTRSGLPTFTLVIWKVVSTPFGSGLPAVAFSMTLPPPPCTSNRSANVGSRTSRETVVRNRKN